MHQWYWSYEYSDYETESGDLIEYDSYMLPDSDLELGQYRLLEVDNPVVLPENTHVRFIVTSSDVLHDFALPAAGIKMDAAPGRLNQCSLLGQRQTEIFGQCSELCGTYHGFMPINVKITSIEDYLSWIDSLILFFTGKSILDNQNKIFNIKNFMLIIFSLLLYYFELFPILIRVLANTKSIINILFIFIIFSFIFLFILDSYFSIQESKFNSDHLENFFPLGRIIKSAKKIGPFIGVGSSTYYFFQRKWDMTNTEIQSHLLKEVNTANQAIVEMENSISSANTNTVAVFDRLRVARSAAKQYQLKYDESLRGLISIQNELLILTKLTITPQIQSKIDALNLQKDFLTKSISYYYYEFKCKDSYVEAISIEEKNGVYTLKETIGEDKIRETFITEAKKINSDFNPEWRPNIDKNAIINYEDIKHFYNNFKENIQSLNDDQLVAFINLMLCPIYFFSFTTLISIFFGNFLINHFNLEVKYPALAKIIKYRRNFQRYYLYINIGWILLTLIFQFSFNLAVLFV